MTRFSIYPYDVDQSPLDTSDIKYLVEFNDYLLKRDRKIFPRLKGAFLKANKLLTKC